MTFTAACSYIRQQNAVLSLQARYTICYCLWL